MTLLVGFGSKVGFTVHYSNKSRGMRKKAEVATSEEPLAEDVVEKILQHCGLWQASSARAPPDEDSLILDLDVDFSDSPIDSTDQADESQELKYVDIDTFLASC